MGTNYFYEKLKEISVINTHEHLWDESWRLEHPGDWAGLFSHYGHCSFKVAGMTASEEAELFSPESPHHIKWNVFSKYYPLIKNTAYIKAAVISIRDVYGIDKIDSDSMQELSVKIRDSVKPGFHRKVLRDIANIDYCLVSSFDTDKDGHRIPVRSWGDTDLLRPDFYADGIVYPTIFSLMERETGIECNTLSGWLKAIDIYFEKYAPLCWSIKIGLAYRRALDFDEGVPFSTAEKLYNEHYAHGPLNIAEIKPLVDFLFYKIVEKAKEYHLPLKFHTGVYAGYNGINFNAQEGNVRHLAKLAVNHPECKVIAMHIAYPFQDQLVMAVKQVVNFYADMAWAWIVDTEASKDFMKKVLTAAPITKVTGFGGDYSLVENTHGHLELTRRAMADVLSDMTSSSYFDKDEAVEMGRYLLRDSAELLYKR